jgi:2-polyprenyl-3-methyl-5-hydroxy-6-metoxy-1,4-benzoquinol methylase
MTTDKTCFYRELPQPKTNQVRATLEVLIQTFSLTHSTPIQGPACAMMSRSFWREIVAQSLGDGVGHGNFLRFLAQEGYNVCSDSILRTDAAEVQKRLGIWWSDWKWQMPRSTSSQNSFDCIVHADVIEHLPRGSPQFCQCREALATVVV